MFALLFVRFFVCPLSLEYILQANKQERYKAYAMSVLRQ